MRAHRLSILVLAAACSHAARPGSTTTPKPAPAQTPAPAESAWSEATFAANCRAELARRYPDAKIEAIDPTALDAPVAADRDILLNHIRSSLLTLEVIRPWEKDPDTYSTGVTNSIFVVMERPYAPVNIRFRAAIEREKLIPQALAEARMLVRLSGIGSDWRDLEPGGRRVHQRFQHASHHALDAATGIAARHF